MILSIFAVAFLVFAALMGLVITASRWPKKTDRDIPGVNSRVTWHQDIRNDLKSVVSVYELIELDLKHRESANGKSALNDEARKEAAALVRSAHEIAERRQGLKEAIRKGGTNVPAPLENQMSLSQSKLDEIANALAALHVQLQGSADHDSFSGDQLRESLANVQSLTSALAESHETETISHQE